LPALRHDGEAGRPGTDALEGDGLEHCLLESTRGERRVLLVAIGLAVLGVAAIVVGIVAIRDEAPAWALRIKRPGWLIALGIPALLLALLVNVSRTNFTDDVAEFVGQPVECDSVGTLDVEGEERDVVACQNERGTHLGCFVEVNGAVVDVSLRAEDEGTGETTKPDC
jgi:hypothetical protein